MRVTPVTSYRPRMMTSLLICMSTMLLMSTEIEAYSSGPPVNKPDVCNSLSLTRGHRGEPKSSSPPFKIRILTTNNCYKVDEPITGTRIDSFRHLRICLLALMAYICLKVYRLANERKCYPHACANEVSLIAVLNASTALDGLSERHNGLVCVPVACTAVGENVVA